MKRVIIKPHEARKGEIRKGRIPHAVRKEMGWMARFIPKEKLSKKAQKELNRQRRVTWDFSPVTKAVESRKIYSRKRKAQNRDDYGLSFFHSVSLLRVTA